MSSNGSIPYNSGNASLKIILLDLTRFKFYRSNTCIDKNVYLRLFRYMCGDNSIWCGRNFEPDNFFFNINKPNK